ncbi:MAG TPA: hypothetical protein VMF06_12760 [Candidatus Limnocylindria bacterium]|jgi:hypothetical protein|nr:hypothetical protein [Candidatus Limnocylindria bacterium]
MRIIEPGISRQLLILLRGPEHIRMDCVETSTGYESITGEYNDGKHLIDIQVLQSISNQYSTLAIRFSLCSYDSIDDIFIELVRDILSRWDAECWLMTSAIGQKNRYSPGDSQWLISALPDEIVEMRRYWQNMFGLKHGVVQTSDSFSLVGAVSS